MGKLYKGTVTVWVKLRDTDDSDPAQVIDGLLYATAQAAGIALGVGMFPENVTEVTETTMDDFRAMTIAEGESLGIDADEVNQMHDHAEAKAQAATV